MGVFLSDYAKWQDVKIAVSPWSQRNRTVAPSGPIVYYSNRRSIFKA
jgi:hypothetical protein